VKTRIIDEILLQELINLGQDVGQALVPELMQKFRAEFPTQLLKLRALISEKDFPAIELFAHSIKGSAATLGAMRVHKACEIIEENAANLSEVTEAQLNDVQFEVTKAFIYLDNFVAESSALFAA
jgi:HPt (histidine-containing phosphotransfer) domain-containing protein